MNMRSRPRGRISLACALAATVVAAGAAVALTAEPAKATGSETVSPQAPAPTEAADEATALALAYRYNKPIRVLAATDESSETYAQPGGTLRMRQTAKPERVRRAGTWVPVDPTLRWEGSSVVPNASTLDMKLSGGGSGPMVTLIVNGRSLSLSWPRPLPTPVLTGDTATYPEVLPGVDLRLSAQVDSFGQVLVVKNANAARNTELAQLHFGLKASGVTVKQDAVSGMITAIGPSGEVVFTSDTARMWDQPLKGYDHTTDIAPRLAVSVGPTVEPGPDDPAAEPAHSVAIPVRVSPTELTVTPSAGLLSAADTNYPVYIDPGWNGGKEIWTHVSLKSPNTSYWTDKSTRTNMRVGQLWNGTSSDDWRTIVQFTVPAALRSSSIKHAYVMTNVYHSADCSPSPMQIWRTNYVSKSAAVTWNNTKSKWWKLLGEVKATANKHECPKGNDEVKFAQTAVKNEFQDVATKKAGSITLAFRAKSESDKYQWKKLVPDSTFLDIEFNHGPGVPTKVGFSPCNTTACTAPVSTYDSTPALKMAVADADGGALRYEYEVWNSAKSAAVVKSGTSVTGVAQNALRSWTVPTKNKLADGQYYWRGRGCDTYGCGGYSGWYAFLIDTKNPGNPTVTSTLYSPTEWKGGPGIPGTFTFHPGGGKADGVKTYNWSLNGGTTSPVTAAADGTASKTITPVKDMVNTLRVTAIDSAGNISGGVNWTFLVHPIGDSWNWALDEATGTVASSQPVNNQPATITGGGVSWMPSGYHGTSGSAWLTGAGDLDTAAPVLPTTGAAGFTVAAAVYLGAQPGDPADAPPGDPEGDPDGDTQPGDEPTTGGDPDGSDPADNSDAPPQAAPLLPAANQVAVSQDGLHTSLFRLGYRTDLDLTGDGVADPAWCFTVSAQDSADSARSSACTTQYLHTDTWVQLTGVYDKQNGKVTLYVQGSASQLGAVATVNGRADWDANGRFAIGRGRTADVPADRWAGGLDEVYAVPRQWTDEEVDAVVDHAA
jgi:hypothetical protein